MSYGRTLKNSTGNSTIECFYVIIASRDKSGEVKVYRQYMLSQR